MIGIPLCIALHSIGQVIMMPLIARRLEDLGAGVGAFGAGAALAALAGALASWISGRLADRVGRGRILRAALGLHMAATFGYAAAMTAAAYSAVRIFTAAASAAAVPLYFAVMADRAPPDRTATGMGFVAGGASLGWIVGPLLGGALYDRLGFLAASLCAGILSAASLIATGIRIPVRSGTRPGAAADSRSVRWTGGPSMIPAILRIRTALLVALSFLVSFCWSFFEPAYMFHVYDDLGWSPTRLGSAMSVYGVALTFGSILVGGLSDRIGRRAAICLGLVLYSAQFVGLAAVTVFIPLVGTFIIAAVGNAMVDASSSAAYVDDVPEGRRASALGVKWMAGSLGAVAGPAAAAVFIPIAGNHAAIRLAAVAVGGLAFASLALCSAGILRHLRLSRSDLPRDRTRGIRSAPDTRTR